MNFNLSMRTSLRATLLATVSAGAIFVMVERGAKAQEANGTWLELGGMYDLWDASKGNQYFLLPQNTAKPKDGFHAFGGIGVPLAGTPYSFALRAKWGESGSRADSYYNAALFVTGASVENKEEHAAIDFEVGRDVGLGILGVPEGALKAKAGVRYTHFSSNESGTGTFSAFGTGPVSVERKTNLFGPRIGLEGSIPVDQSRASVDFNVNGGVLFGKQKFQDDSAVPFATAAPSRSKTVAVPNVDAYLGLGFLLPEMNGKFSIGYSVDAYFGAVDAGYQSRRKGDRIFHGPTAKFTIQLPSN